MGRHLSCGITQCYLLPDTSERAPPEPQPAGGYSITYPGGMEGSVDISKSAMEWTGVELATSRSQSDAYNLCVLLAVYR